MADLDDFFAKKSKKKKSKNSKRTSEKPEGNEDRLVQLSVGNTQDEETEWKELKDTVEISADDLKLQTLSVDEDLNDKGGDASTHGKSKTQENGTKEQEASKSGQGSPWQAVQKEREVSIPATTVTKMPNVTTGSRYIPPSMRRNPSSQQQQFGFNPPDINSKAAFPSLVSNESEKKKKPSSINDNIDEDEYHPQMYTELHLQNKYSALRNE